MALQGECMFYQVHMSLLIHLESIFRLAIFGNHFFLVNGYVYNLSTLSFDIHTVSFLGGNWPLLLLIILAICPQLPPAIYAFYDLYDHWVYHFHTHIHTYIHTYTLIYIYIYIFIYYYSHIILILDRYIYTYMYMYVSYKIICLFHHFPLGTSFWSQSLLTSA